MEALLGIDLGTTGCKAAVCSLNGRELGTSYLEYPLLNLSPVMIEQDAGQWWALTAAAVRGALAAAGDGCRICALSVSSQGISFVPLDRSGYPLSRAISWLDTRASSEALEIESLIGEERLFNLTGKRPGSVYILPKLLWLKRHQPEVYQKTAKFLTAHDYLLYRLCGEMLTDYSMASGSLLLDLRRLEWSPELLQAFDIALSKLPDLAWAGTPAGKLSAEAAADMGLPPGTPVIVGGQDQKCAALGAAISAGKATVSLGTASAISALSQIPVLDAGRRIPTFPFVLPGCWDMEGVINTAGAAFKWLRGTMFPGLDYQQMDTLAGLSSPGGNGVSFFPHLSGAGSPSWRLDSKGAFAGLSLAVSPGDIIRSVLEGVAFQIRENLDIIETIIGVQELILFGGGARSRLWSEIISQVTGKPVSVSAMIDVANWGACLLAAKGVGYAPEDLGASMGDFISERYFPERAQVERYKELYAGYRAAEHKFLA